MITICFRLRFVWCYYSKLYQIVKYFNKYNIFRHYFTIKNSIIYVNTRPHISRNPSYRHDIWCQKITLVYAYRRVMLLFDIISCLPVMDNRIPECDGFFPASTSVFPLTGIDFFKKCAKLQREKALTKTYASGKIPREDAALVKGARTPAEGVTTSEPQVGNVLPGAPVIASMSGTAERGATRVEPWNTASNCIPPLNCFRGWAIFYPPQFKRR